MLDDNSYMISCAFFFSRFIFHSFLANIVVCFDTAVFWIDNFILCSVSQLFNWRKKNFGKIFRLNLRITRFPQKKTKGWIKGYRSVGPQRNCRAYFELHSEVALSDFMEVSKCCYSLLLLQMVHDGCNVLAVSNALTFISVRGSVDPKSIILTQSYILVSIGRRGKRKEHLFSI